VSKILNIVNKMAKGEGNVKVPGGIWAGAEKRKQKGITRANVPKARFFMSTKFEVKVRIREKLYLGCGLGNKSTADQVTMKK